MERLQAKEMEAAAREAMKDLDPMYGLNNEESEATASNAGD